MQLGAQRTRTPFWRPVVRTVLITGGGQGTRRFDVPPWLQCLMAAAFLSPLPAYGVVEIVSQEVPPPGYTIHALHGTEPPEKAAAGSLVVRAPSNGVSEAERPLPPPPAPADRSAAGDAPLDRQAPHQAREHDEPKLVSARAVRRGLAILKRPTAFDNVGELRLLALHSGEFVRTRPFREDGRVDASAFGRIARLMRCKRTDHTVSIDPQLVRVLTQLSTLYDQPVQVISGHRDSSVDGTNSTSQHTIGRAADIRVPGVSLEELRSTAMHLGGRGIGVYPEHDFLHVDMRRGPRYFWRWEAGRGEQPMPLASRSGGG